MKFNLKKILVPTDFSPHSLSALHYAAAMAKHSDAEVILLHVIENYADNTALSQVINVTEAIKKAINDKLVEIKNNNMDLWGIPISVRLVNGKIHKVIIDMVEKEGVDLIVMGTHGSSGIDNFGKYILGSNAYRIVRVANCPVITVREALEKKEGGVKFGKIVLPLDTTKETQDKVVSAIKIAKVFKATIHLLSISTRFDEATRSYEKLGKQLKAVAKQIEQEGVAVETKIIRNENITKAVIDYAEEIDADLIIIMTREESQLIEVTMGSNARKVIEQSNIPVLSIHPGYE
jgi:nucleotide-binding universal stress UspA family protein